MTASQAPDVARVNGLYHVYYSVSTFGSQNSAIGLATSPNMEPSTWIDRGSVGIRSDSSKRDNAIVDAGGSTYYMNFGSFWGGLYQVRMNAGATGTVSGSSSYNIAYQPSGNHAIEGPTLIRRNQYWYLFFSSGVCCGYDQTRPARGQEYKIKVCRSTYPTGGFVSLPCLSSYSCMSLHIMLVPRFIIRPVNRHVSGRSQWR
jgi:arabinan endo-1,5-alpha-L-arabinosidase